MNISLNWLKQYLDISGYTPEELASVGTIAGVEVENIEYLAKNIKKKIDINYQDVKLIRLAIKF